MAGSKDPLARIYPENDSAVKQIIADDKRHGRRTSRTQAVNLIIAEWRAYKKSLAG